MAKEKFERTKPHVNVGTIDHTATLKDTLGQLMVDDTGVADLYSVITFNSQSFTSTSPQTAIVAFPIDDLFVFDPGSSGPAVSIDFQLDVLPTETIGDSQIDITLAILQGGAEFIHARSESPPSVSGPSDAWTTLGQTDLLPQDFVPVDGGGDRVDFSQPFQFGYAFTGEYSTTALSVELGLDNMIVEITTVPEPTSFVLVATMGAAFLWRRLWNS